MMYFFDRTLVDLSNNVWQKELNHGLLPPITAALMAILLDGQLATPNLLSKMVNKQVSKPEFMAHIQYIKRILNTRENLDTWLKGTPSTGYRIAKKPIEATMALHREQYITALARTSLIRLTSFPLIANC